MQIILTEEEYNALKNKNFDVEKKALKEELFTALENTAKPFVRSTAYCPEASQFVQAISKTIRDICNK